MKNKILIGIVIVIALAVSIGLVIFSLGGFKENKESNNNINYNGVEIKNNNISNNEVGANTSNPVDTKNAKLEDLPYNYTLEQAIKDGCFTIIPHSVYNKENLDNFIENTRKDAKNRIPDSIRIATTTIEGQLILYDLSYDGNNYILKMDLTRDEYSAKEDRIIKTNSDIPGRFYSVNLKNVDGNVELWLSLTVQPMQDKNIVNENEKIYIKNLDGKTYEDIPIVSYPTSATVYQIAPEFKAEVLEVFDNFMFVKPIENGENLGDKVSVSKQGKDFDTGDTVRVIYTGLVMETYPAQINVISVEKID